MDDMSRYGKRGYYVKENAPIYFTNDMDKTRLVDGFVMSLVGMGMFAVEMITIIRYMYVCLIIRES